MRTGSTVTGVTLEFYLQANLSLCGEDRNNDMGDLPTPRSNYKVQLSYGGICTHVDKLSLAKIQTWTIAITSNLIYIVLYCSFNKQECSIQCRSRQNHLKRFKAFQDSMLFGLSC